MKRQGWDFQFKENEILLVPNEDFNLKISQMTDEVSRKIAEVETKAVLKRLPIDLLIIFLTQIEQEITSRKGAADERHQTTNSEN